MKIYLEKIILVNRAPFKEFEMDFSENEISVLSAVNGKGKTTVLSHIVDAFHEMTRPHFPQEFEGRENKFYRVSSPIHNLNTREPSFVYLRFKTPTENIDYVDIRNTCTEEQYNDAIKIDQKIPFAELQATLQSENNIKKVSSNFNKEKAIELFGGNVLTYFPSYRFEMPGYLNDPYKIKLDFKKLSGFSGNLTNPMEVGSGLPKLSNWIMDLILDENRTRAIVGMKSSIDNLISDILISKDVGRVRFDVGSRGLGGIRLQIGNIAVNDSQASWNAIYPTVFNLSSGEASLLCLFGEILRQADGYRNDIPLKEITGIVLVDEVDKHLHIKLQKEILPRLFNLFPNIQFIASSHSPFLNMGLAEQASDRSKIKDLDTGLNIKPSDDSQYEEVYQMMLGENQKFKEMYDALKTSIGNGTTPLIITEGKTDIIHIRKAKEKLNLTDLNIEFSNIPISEKGWGYDNLQKTLAILAKDKQPRKIIGVFDRDLVDVLADIEKDGQSFKDYGNNVYAFCISKPTERTFEEISIEHYYSDEELKKENTDGKRLFLGTEFHSSGNSIDGNFETIIKNKAGKNTIIDEKVYRRTDLENQHPVVLSKNDFSELVNSNEKFIEGFNFNNFKLIFDKISEIINEN